MAIIQLQPLKQYGISGPASSLDNEVPVFDGVTGKKIKAGSGVMNPSVGRLDLSEIRAKDINGLKLYDDGGAGIFIKDGGNVGIGISNPTAKLEVSGGLAAAYGSATGDNSVGLGGNASTNYAIAIGDGSVASNSYAIAIGDNSTASSERSTAIGAQSSASGGDYAAAFGAFATASGSKSVTIGRATSSATGAIVIGSHIGPGHFKCNNNIANSIMFSIGGSYPEITVMGSTGNSQATTGRVGIGTKAPATSAKLELFSTTGALLLTRMTTAQKNALTAVNGMILYDTTLHQTQTYENGAWRQI